MAYNQPYPNTMPMGNTGMNPMGNMNQMSPMGNAPFNPYGAGNDMQNRMPYAGGGFLRGLEKFGRGVGRAVKPFIPIAGGALGTALGGPAGGIAGGALGTGLAELLPFKYGGRVPYAYGGGAGIGDMSPYGLGNVLANLPMPNQMPMMPYANGGMVSLNDLIDAMHGGQMYSDDDY